MRQATAFWQGLQAQEADRDGFLHLPSVPAWLFDMPQHLLIRSCYRDLWQIVYDDKRETLYALHG